jgi:hypothetical protein
MYISYLHTPAKMNSEDLFKLTTKIDNINDTDESITSTYLHAELWDDLNRLRQDANRDELINGWKYKDDFEITDNCHLNENKQFSLMPWDHSYVTSLYFSIYH